MACRTGLSQVTAHLRLHNLCADANISISSKGTHTTAVTPKNPAYRRVVPSAQGKPDWTTTRRCYPRSTMIQVTGGAPNCRAGEHVLFIVKAQTVITGEFGGVKYFQTVRNGVDGPERAVRDRSAARAVVARSRRTTAPERDARGGGPAGCGDAFAAGCAVRSSKSRRCDSPGAGRGVERARTGGEAGVGRIWFFGASRSGVALRHRAGGRHPRRAVGDP